MRLQTGSAPLGVGPVRYDGDMNEFAASAPWPLAPADPDVVAALARATGMSGTTARVLVSRGLTDAESVAAFLEPDLDRDWHDPDAIPGMAQAAEKVADAVKAGRHIVVFGDFDLDGVSAASVAALGLRAMGANVSAVVPHRFREGYGLSAAAIERIMPMAPELIVTVDCGISSGAEVATLTAAGVEVVVTDHHEPGDSVPNGVPVANPKLDPGCPSRDLAGAGVSLKLVHAVGRLCGHADTWRELTDLAMLGTVADIVPLRAENRALVAHGVARVRTDPRVPIAALCAAARVTPSTLSAETVAFSLAPRLNAAGRMADSATSLELLLAEDASDAERLAAALDEYNRLRQETESDLSRAAEAQAQRVYHGERGLVLAGEGWHDGVKGIVASRMAQRFGVPAILFAIEDGVAVGSGRSVGSVDLFRALEACADLLTRFGGHEAAVGLALPEEQLPAFTERFVAHLASLPAEQFVSETVADAEISLADVSVELGAELALLEPFGHGNRSPLLVAQCVFLNDRQIVGKNADHLRFSAFDAGVTVPAISFRCKDIETVSAHEAPADLAFQLGIDEWRGRTRAQLLVRDVRLHEPDLSAPAADLVADLFAKADEILAREEYAGIEDAPSFHTKLAGVTFEGRQEVLSRLAPGSPLRLERQPDNQYDPNACAVMDSHGDQVGFLNRRLAAALAPAIDAGLGYDVEVTDVTGGEEGRSLGVNVLLSRRDESQAAENLARVRAERRAELAALSADDLDAELIRAFLGDRKLHAAQEQSLAHLAAGQRTLTVMATGRGKSLIFHLHAARIALREGAASVLVFPLRALVADQAFHLEEVFANVGLAVRTVTGESSESDRDAAFSAIREGELDVVLTTPEFLHFHSGRFAATGRIGFVVVDEAHHVGLARAGHRPAYARLGEAIDAIGDPGVLAVTATANDSVAEQIRATLGISAVVLDPTVRDNLRVEDRRDLGDKDGALVALAAKGDKMVVYVNSREKSVQIARMIRKRVPSVAMRTAFYNGGLSRAARHAVENAFRTGDLSVVVATSAFGEGVNIPDIRHVVLYHLPFNAVEFNQMAGRAGRDGATARIHLFFGGKDGRINDLILASLAPERDDMAALYRTLRDVQTGEGPGFEITNAELAQRAKRIQPRFSLDERGVSTALGIFRELGFVEGEGHGAYRRLTLLPSTGKVELDSSVRYAEGKDEIEQFEQFRAWVLGAEADELLARFNRPILPSHT